MVPFFPRKLNDRKRPRPLLTPRPTCKRRSHLKAGTNGHAILIPLVSDHLTMKIVLLLLFSILAASFGVPLPEDAEEDGEQMREGREAAARTQPPPPPWPSPPSSPQSRTRFCWRFHRCCHCWGSHCRGSLSTRFSSILRQMLYQTNQSIVTQFDNLECTLLWLPLSYPNVL